MSAPEDPLHLELTDDPAQFLADAGDHLAASPVVSTVVATLAQRTIAHDAAGIPRSQPHWWLVVRDGSGAVVGAGMRTAPFGERPPYLLPMPDAAAVGLARLLHDRGEEVLALNGALPAVRVCAEELARLHGGRVEVAQHTRLFELTTLRPPAPVEGRLTRVGEEDVDLALRWFNAFMRDADEQAGRPPGSSAHEELDRDAALRRIQERGLYFWLDGDGTPVHLTGTNPPAFGVARIGPVYTPPGQRGRGWAANAVAAVSARILAEGHRACLFTDQANPVSNRLYVALGYRAVVDMANLLVSR